MLDEVEYEVLRIVRAQVERLEQEIDTMNDPIEPLKTFILPGGSQLAAHLHVCRTVARRAERLAVELASHDHVNQATSSFWPGLKVIKFTIRASSGMSTISLSGSPIPRPPGRLEASIV